MGEYQLRVYVAASRDVAGEADAMAKRLASAAVRITSRWHVNETKLVDPSVHDARREVLVSNLADLTGSDVVVALMDRGKPRATYAEIGYALASGQAVVWVAPSEDLVGDEDPRACIFDAHPFVLRVRSEDEVAGALKKVSDGMYRMPDGSPVSPAWINDAIKLLAAVGAREKMALQELGGIDGFNAQWDKIANRMQQVAMRASAVPPVGVEVVEWFFAVLDMLAFAKLNDTANAGARASDAN